MRCALEVWGADYRRLLDTCRRADALGFDGFYYGESPTGLHLECWTTLAALARETSRIRLGPVITNVLPSYRSTVLLAKQAATAAVVSGGRIDFRTGAGAAASYGRPWWQPFGVDYGPYAQRAADVDRVLARLRPLWAGEAVDLGSGHEATLGLEVPPIPVTVAAVGPTGMTMAAAHAEVWESSFRTPGEFSSLDTRFREIEAALPSSPTGRRPVLRSLEIDAVVGTTPARAEAALATFARERAGEDVDRLLARALVGTPPAVAETLSALALTGVDQVVVALHDPHDADGLEALALARRYAGSAVVSNPAHR